MKILAPVGYPWRFNGPRMSRHQIKVRKFLPVNYISKRYEGVTVFAHNPIDHVDLIHGYNRIPIGHQPYVIGFESHLPRAFGMESTAYYNALLRSLGSNRCKRIIASSQFALKIATRLLKNMPYEEEILGKFSQRYPSINTNVPVLEPIFLDGVIKASFVGAHFSRKGGLSCLIAAKLAYEDGFPLQIDIVSALGMGAAPWIDPPRDEFYAPYRELLALPNITLHGRLSNFDTLRIMGESHAVLLPTFGDTFGYNVFEAMVQGVPAIVTRQGALPEFVEHSKNGFLIDLECNEDNEWTHPWTKNLDAPEYEKHFSNEVHRIGVEVYGHLKWIANNRSRYEEMRRAARTTAVSLFDAMEASQYWDNLYDQCLFG
jgi:glycosyltransferase involved in cell wall biosynthesis